MPEKSTVEEEKEFFVRERGDIKMSELYGFILLEVRGFGLLAGIFLPDQYRHEEASRILRKAFFYDDRRLISSGVISFEANDETQGSVLVHELYDPSRNRSSSATMQITVTFFQSVTPTAMAIIRERLAGDQHVDHRYEMVFLI